MQAYQPDRSVKGKLRRQSVRMLERRPALRAPAGPMLSITFDDIPESAAGAGAELLESRGLRGAFYVSAGLAGTDGPMGRYAGPDAVAALAAAGHEIGCHTFSHLDCGQATRERIEDDVAANAAMLEDWGAARVETFAYPYGDVSWQAKQALSDRFTLLRTVRSGVLGEGADLAQAPAVGVEGSDGEQAARRWLNTAHRRGVWLILYTHDVRPEPSPWGATPDSLSRLLDEALQLGFEVVTPAEGARRLGAAA
jgi:peptidoglycan/xylan/chitin deacetylase (PgdA/CDA1 family)